MPIRIHCRADELVYRVDNADRKARSKWVDPSAVRTYVDTREVIRIDEHSPLEIDTTECSPDDAALQILEHIDRFA